MDLMLRYSFIMKSIKNQAAMMVDVGKIEIKEISMPVPNESEVLIKTEYIGICGSDVHFFETGKRKGRKFKLPFILGHECSGTIIEKGKKVRNLAIGDRVTIEPQKTCGKCEYCRGGRYNLCEEVLFPSVPPYNGMLRRYFTFPDHLCFKLPDSVSTLEGALVEPMAVGFQAAKCGEVGLGKTITILGTGSIGLTTLLACRAMGAKKVTAVDLYDKRLKLAMSLGAEVINAKSDDIVNRLCEITEGKGADIVFETAGTKVTASLTGRILKKGGIIVLVGNVEGKTSFDFLQLMYKEGEIHTIYRYRNMFPTAIDYLCYGTGIQKIISDQFGFLDTQKAFKKVANEKQNVTKVLIKFD